MSGFGLAGFGTGFLQGFDAMGRQFAQRGVMQREAEQSRRLDRTLALEEELKRQEAARLEREASSMEQYRGAQTRALDDQHNWFDKQRQSELESEAASRKLTGAQTTALGDQHNWYDKKAQSDLDSDAAARGLTTEQAGQIQDRREYDRTDRPLTVAGKQADVAASQAGAAHTQATTEQIKNTTRYAEQDRPLTVAGKQADLAATQASTGVNLATAEGKKLDNQSKKLEVDQAQRREDQRQQASQAWERLDRGEGSPDDVRRIYPLLGAATNPEHERDAELIFQTVQAAAQNKGDVEVFNQPEVLGALNRTFGETVNVTRGMPVTTDGQYVAKDTRIVKMIKHPTDNLIGFEVQVQPEASPERRAQIEQAMQKATPAQREQLMAELNPQPYQSGLTNQRTPVAQGGQMRWFSPQEVQKMVMGLKGISDLRASKPEAIQAMTELKRRIDAGELNAPTDPKALETEIKVRAENRANRAEMRQIEGDTRSAKKEKRAERGDAFKEAAGIIDKQYATVDPLTGMSSFQGDSGQKAADEKLMVDKVLRRNPNMSGAQALEKARRIMAKQGKSPAASAAQSGTSGGRKDYSSLW